MKGFFIKDLIQLAWDFVERKKRVRSARRWPVIDAVVSRFTSEPDAQGMRPVMLYSYELNGMRWQGICVGVAIDDTRLLSMLLKHLTPQLNLRVRYDPTDFSSSLVLNRDNPELLFRVDLDPQLLVMVD